MEGFDCGGDGWQHDSARMVRPQNSTLWKTMLPSLTQRTIKMSTMTKSKCAPVNTRQSCSTAAETKMICLLAWGTGEFLGYLVFLLRLIVHPRKLNYTSHFALY